MTMIERSERMWQAFLPEATSAIEEMRDPTARMIEAMDENAGTIAPQYAYEAAIDAALNEQVSG